jgi:hypothetical protein
MGTQQESEPVSSVSTVTKQRAAFASTGVRSPVEAEDFSSTLYVQPALGPTQPTTVGTEGYPRV